MSDLFSWLSFLSMKESLLPSFPLLQMKLQSSLVFPFSLCHLQNGFGSMFNRKILKNQFFFSILNCQSVLMPLPPDFISKLQLFTVYLLVLFVIVCKHCWSKDQNSISIKSILLNECFFAYKRSLFSFFYSPVEYFSPKVVELPIQMVRDGSFQLQLKKYLFHFAAWSCMN